jgi:hypothetical protein
VGAPVIIDQWGGATSLSGRVRRIEPSGYVVRAADRPLKQRRRSVTQGACDLGVYDVMGKPFEIEALHAKPIAACAAA